MTTIDQLNYNGSMNEIKGIIESEGFENIEPVKILENEYAEFIKLTAYKSNQKYDFYFNLDDFYDVQYGKSNSVIILQDFNFEI